MASHTRSGSGGLAKRWALERVSGRFDKHLLTETAERIAKAIDTAFENLSPARLGHAMVSIEGANENRMKENGPTDPELTVLRIDAASGQPLAFLTSFSAHPTVLGAQNMGFSIPINTVHRDLDDVRKFGKVRRPLLGLRYLTVDENLKDKLGLLFDYGALVVGGHNNDPVIPDSPADRAGIQLKDLILECNGEKITKEKTIQDFLEDCAVGDVLDLKVQRGKKGMSVKVTLAERR